MISIILINDSDSTKYLYETVLSIEEKITNIDYEIIVINLKIDAEDDTREKLKVYFLKTQNFAKAKNFAVTKSKYDVLFFLKVGISIKVNPFLYFFEKFKSRNYGAVTLKLYDYRNDFKINFWQEIGLAEELEEDALNEKILKGNFLKLLQIEQKFHEVTSVERVSADAMIINKNVLNLLGGFNEYLVRYYDDADLCKRLIEKKHTNYFYPFCKLVDLRFVEIDLPLFIKSRLRYYKLHNSFLIRSILRISLAIKYLLLSLTFKNQNIQKLKSVLFPY